MKRIYTLFYLGFISMCLLVCISAYQIDIMDVDAAQYANISREMSMTGNYLQVYEQGKDYLDKPPMLFWLSALSIKILGASNFAYKFPSILLFILSLYSFYLWVKQLYNKETALVATLILSSSQAIFLMTNDVRTDLLLMSFTIMSIAHIYLYTQNRKMIDFVIGFMAMAAGLMTKGPIAVFMIVASLGTHFLLKKDWKNIFNYRYVLGIILVCILLIPMCYGLYTQFDLHPEKTVYGIQSPSGIKFFFWTQSFGRITGESSWANNMGFEYLFTNILWAFFPWSLLFILALIYPILEVFHKQKRIEYISIAGFILTYIALASSKYQLPHYIFITFPLIAILTAHFVLHSNWSKAIYLLSISVLLAIIAQFFIVLYVFDSNQYYWISFIFLEILLGSILFVYLHKKQLNRHKWILTTSFIALFFNILLTHLFYKNLIQFQSSSAIGKYINKEHIQSKDINSYDLREGYNAIHFYSKQIITTNETSSPTKKYVITTDDGKNKLLLENAPYKVIQSFEQYNITKLQWKFLNKKTRNESIKHLYMLEKK